MKKNAIVLMSFLCCITLLYTGCKKDDEFENLYADAGNDFLDIENDGYVVTLNAQAPPSGQSGIWRIYNGDYGVFQDLNNSISEFYGEPGETYLLGWEVADGNQYEASTINVSYVPMHPVIDMMVDDSTYNNISLYLGAEEAKFGAMGLWEITDGSGGRIENPESHNEALFIGEPKSEYTLRWTMTYGSKKEYEEISFITDELIADAGEDDLDIKSSEDEVKYFNLNAVLPAGATGTWEVLGKSVV